MVGRSVATVSEVLWTLLINKNPRREPLATHVQQGCISCCEHRSLMVCPSQIWGPLSSNHQNPPQCVLLVSQPRTHITRSALSCRWRPGCLPKGERGVSTCPGSFSGSSSLVSTRCVASSTCVCCWAGASSCQSAARPIYAPVVCVCVRAPMGAASSMVSLHRVDEQEYSHPLLRSEHDGPRDAAVGGCTPEGDARQQGALATACLQGWRACWAVSPRVGHVVACGLAMVSGASIARPTIRSGRAFRSARCFAWSALASTVAWAYTSASCARCKWTRGLRSRSR